MHVVYVHGIGHHGPGFWKPWHAAIRSHLRCDVDVRSVHWSDLVNDAASLPREAWASTLAAEIDGELIQRQAREGAAPLPREGSGFFQVDDFLKYCLSVDVRELVLGRFRQAVCDVSDAVIIAHSWGSVVAWEALATLPTRLCVRSLVLVGAALSLKAVQRNLIPRCDVARPGCCRRAVNLDAMGDPVGGTMLPFFSVGEEHLGLVPVGCDATLGFVNPSDAHGSYFVPENMRVVRDVFAKEINAACGV